MKTIIKSFLITATALFVVACGGGKGGNIGSGNQDTLFPNSSRLAYANDKNAQEVADLLFGYNTDSIVPANARKIANGKKLSILNLVLENITEFNKSSNLSKSSRLTDESDYCDSGSLYKETLSDGSVEFRFNNCTQGYFKFDGIIRKHRYNNKLVVKYVTDFTVQDLNSDDTIVVKKESSVSLEELGNERYKITLNLVTNQNGKSSGFENVVFIYDDSEVTMYQKSGNIYINNLQEYVKWDSSYNMAYTPLVYDNGTIIDGEAHYIMRNAKLIIYANGDGTATYNILR